MLQHGVKIALLVLVQDVSFSSQPYSVSDPDLEL